MASRPRTIPRKLPRQARSQATVDAILVATARVLVREGYEGASTNRVALAAGVSIGSLYQYFPSKEALVAALVDQHMSAMNEIAISKLATVADAPLEVGAREIVRAMIEAHRVDPKLHKVLIEQVPRVGRMGKVAQLEERLALMLTGVLTHRRKQIRPKHLDVAVFVLVHAVEALAHAAVLERPDLLSDDRLVDEITELVVRYLEPDTSRR